MSGTPKYIKIAKQAKDWTGVRVGRLVVLGPVERRVSPNGKGGDIIWLCQCDCGNTSKVYAGNIRQKQTQSCGCIQLEVARAVKIKHGLAGTPEHNSWVQARRRCYSEKFHYYHRYGGRGITVCDEWRDDFLQFLEDMGERPEPKELYSLDRIDNDGNYEPGNCRWATMKEQQNNTCKQEGNVVP